MSNPEDIERAKLEGIKEGMDDATIALHSKRLQAINGSLDRFTAALGELQVEIRAGLTALSDEIRTMQEEARAAVLAVEVSRDTLAAETERRRLALVSEGVTGERKFTRGRQTAAVVVAVAGLLLATVLGLRELLP